MGTSDDSSEAKEQPRPLSPEEQRAKNDEARAGADKARTEADQKAAELAEYQSPHMARLREANAAKDAAVAEKEAAAARAEQVKALIPDLSTVTDSTLDVTTDQPILGNALAFRALQHVAESIATEIMMPDGDVKGGPLVLVTSDGDLAGTDAAYHDMTTAQGELIAMADQLLTDPEPPAATSPGHKERRDIFPPGTSSAVAAVASALPAALSLLAAHRTLSSAPVTVTDLAAEAKIVGVLRGRHKSWHFVHENLRLIDGESGVYAQDKALSGRRTRLMGRKLVLEQRKTEAAALLAARTAALKNVKAAKNATDQQKADAQAVVDAAERDLAAATIQIGLVDALAAAIDQFSATIRAVAPGTRRSLLATAALQEKVHHGFTHVLLVKTQTGEATQVRSDRPLWFKDRFTTMVSLTVAYMLVEVTESEIVSSGTVTSLATAHGEIGSDFTLDVR